MLDWTTNNLDVWPLTSSGGHTQTIYRAFVNRPLPEPEPDWKIAEVCCPPPVPVALASLPMLPRQPPEGLRGVAWLARLHGGARQRRGRRARTLERKDAA